jgi:hypothetical protein
MEHAKAAFTHLPNLPHLEALQFLRKFETTTVAPTAVAVGLTTDKLKYMGCLIAVIPMSFILFRFVARSAASRHMLSIVIGSALCVFNFYEQMFHPLVTSVIAYMMMRWLSRDVAPAAVSVFMVGYLSCLHLQAQFADYGGWNLDVTGPQMILTLKLSALAWNLHDARHPENAERRGCAALREYAVVEMPSLLEYFGFVFFFPSFLAAPFIEFSHYRRWAGGNWGSEASGKGWFGPTVGETLAEVARRFGVALLCAAIFLNVSSRLDPAYLTTRQFFDTPAASPLGVMIVGTGGAAAAEAWEALPKLVHQIFYVWLAMSFSRARYYLGWKLAECGCVASGIAFSGRDAAGGGRPLWLNARNVDILKVEFGGSVHSTMTYWNMGVAHWLRFYVYTRLPDAFATFGTYMASAFWHGFYPGYYMTFASGALLTAAHRTLRRCLFQRFGSALWYHFAGFLLTSVGLAIAVVPFILLSYEPSIAVWKELRFCVHVGAAAIVALGVLTGAGKKMKEKRKEA